jgi:hypothetical protein
MKTRTTSHLAAVVSTFLLIAIVTMVRAAGNSVPGWNPDAWANESTMQIMTTSPEGEEHWSTLWVVVIDHKLYARLGNRSYDRIQKNKTIPWVKLKIDDKQFDKVLVRHVGPLHGASAHSAPDCPTYGATAPAAGGI